MLNTPYPSLTQFIGCYIHQDFEDELESPDRAIAAFLQNDLNESIQKTGNMIS